MYAVLSPEPFSVRLFHFPFARGLSTLYTICHERAAFTHILCFYLYLEACFVATAGYTHGVRFRWDPRKGAWR